MSHKNLRHKMACYATATLVNMITVQFMSNHDDFKVALHYK